MTDSEITTAMLRQIRDEIIATRVELGAHIDATNQRIDVTNERLDVTNERLAVVESVVRDTAAQVVILGRYVKNRQDAAIDDLRKRVGKLEKEVG